MLERSAAYEAAVAGSPRHIFLRAVVDISDPDKVWLPVTSSPEAPWSRGEELHDRSFSVPPRQATLEPGRWLLGGGFEIFPDGCRVPGDLPQGWASKALSGFDGTFASPQWAALNFSGMSILQAFSVFFSTDPLDGVPADFTVEVLYNDTAYFTQAVTGNRETEMQFDGFTVYDPTSIRVTVTRWSLPGRRVRMVEIVPGIYEDWDADLLSRFSVTQQGQFSCLSLPYGRAEIAMDNHTRRFDPRRKDGLFQSIEERQGVELHIGVLLPAGGVEYKGLGTYYQAGDGWKSGENAMDIKWTLVDIIGLLAERTFLVPETLPETLEGWLQALVLQLGNAFRRRYRVDPAYADLPVTANSREAVTDKKCKDILRWACQASGTWPRADQATGALTAEPLWSQGARVDLDNLVGYPVMRANESLAALIFQLADADGTEIVIPGNATSAEKTVTIINPFALRADHLAHIERVRHGDLLPLQIHAILADVADAHAGHQRHHKGGIDLQIATAPCLRVCSVEILLVGGHGNGAKLQAVRVNHRAPILMLIDIAHRKILQITPGPGLKFSHIIPSFLAVICSEPLAARWTARAHT